MQIALDNNEKNMQDVLLGNLTCPKQQFLQHIWNSR